LPDHIHNSTLSVGFLIRVGSDMGFFKELDIRLRSGGDDAVAAFNEYVSSQIAGTVSADTGMEWIPSNSFKCLPVGYKMTSTGRWIPIEERWPSHGSDVLVAYKCGECVLLGVGEFDGTIFNDDGLTVPYFKGIRGFEVTHWMPLPSPPEVK